MIFGDETVGVLVSEIFELNEDVLAKGRDAGLHELIEKIIIRGSFTYEETKIVGNQKVIANIKPKAH